jgi:hypothetical protein
MEFLEGKRKPEDVRELCGICSLPTLVIETLEEFLVFFKKIKWST